MRLGVVSDVHHCVQPRPGASYHNPYDVAGALGRLRGALQWFADEQVEAVVLDGDLADLGDGPSLAAVVEAVANCWDGPALAVPGNHDVEEQPDALARAVAEGGRGRLRVASARGTEHGGMRIAGIDRVDGSAPLSGEAWGTGPVVVATHFPLLSRADAVQRHGLKYAGDLPGRERVLAGVLGREGTVVVNGHLHVRDTHADGGLLQLSVAALVEPPFEATILDLERQKVRRRAVRMRDADVAQEPVLAPADETWVFDAGRWAPLDPRR
jgi:3',5'-cyclic AMP phosphodiesterase CpdA